LPSLWLAWSRLGAGSGDPAGERLVPAVVRWLEEHRLPELVVAAVTGDQDVTHAAAAAGGFAGRFTPTRLPAHLRLAGPQLVTERAVLRLILEHRDGHLNDHALTSSDASTITMTSAQRPVQVNGLPMTRRGAGTRIRTCRGCAWIRCLSSPAPMELASLSKALRAQCASMWPRLQLSSNDGTDECLRTVTAPGTPVTTPQMLRRYGASARSARARRTYDRIMAADP
jgi:hypothetical protein